MSEEFFKSLQTLRHARTAVESETAAQELVMMVRPDLVDFVHSRCFPFAEDANDIIQDTLVRMIQKQTSFKGLVYRQFWGWCRKIAYRLIMDMWRKKRRELADSFDSDSVETLIDASAESDPISAAARMDLDTVKDWLDEADPKCRKLLWMFYIQDTDYESLARKFKISYKAIVQRVTRCLDSAKKLVAKKERLHA